MQPLLLLAPTSGCAASPLNAVVKHTVCSKVKVCQLARSRLPAFEAVTDSAGLIF